MIVCESCALSECIRDRCKRTGTGTEMEIVKGAQFLNNFFLVLYCSFVTSPYA